MCRIPFFTMIVMFALLSAGCGHPDPKITARSNFYIWIENSDVEGWELDNSEISNIVIDKDFFPRTTHIAIDTSLLNEESLESLSELIAFKWYSFFPDTLKEPFTLTVILYDGVIDSRYELVRTDIEPDGSYHSY